MKRQTETIDRTVRRWRNLHVTFSSGHFPWHDMKLLSGCRLLLHSARTAAYRCARTVWPHAQQPQRLCNLFATESTCKHLQLNGKESAVRHWCFIPVWKRNESLTKTNKSELKVHLLAFSAASSHIWRSTPVQTVLTDEDCELWFKSWKVDSAWMFFWVKFQLQADGESNHCSTSEKEKQHDSIF